MKILNDLSKNNKGYSLVEILAAIIIVSSVMIVSTSSIFSSARISVNNEIADRANTMSVRVLEITKKPDKTALNCDTGDLISLQDGGNFGVGTIDLSNSNQAENVCLNVIQDLTLIEECTERSRYRTQVEFDFGREQARDEVYCIQVRIEDLPDSEFTKVTVRTVFNDLSDQNLTRTLYGLL